MPTGDYGLTKPCKFCGVPVCLVAPGDKDDPVFCSEWCRKGETEGMEPPIDYGDCPPSKWDANWPPFQF